MVVLGRFRKPKQPRVLGSPQTDDIIPAQAPATPLSPTPLIARNFSYPINLTGGGSQSSPDPAERRSGQSTWDQLGEICNFSPDSRIRTRQAGTSGLEDPFFFKSDREPYICLVSQELKASVSPASSHGSRPYAAAAREPQHEKRQRHSTLPTLSTSHDQNVTLLRVEGEHSTRGDRATKVLEERPFSRHLNLKTSTSAEELNRGLLEEHQPDPWTDIAHPIALSSSTLNRPLSSSAQPTVESRRYTSTSTPMPGLSPVSACPKDFDATTEQHLQESADVQTPLVVRRSNMDLLHRKSSSQGGVELARKTSLASDGESMHASSSASSIKRTEREGRTRWLSHLKDWISVSEPSNQALEQHRRNTYKKAGITLNDPRANAKLHLPVGTLPAEAIKPSGPGPDPEDVALERARLRRKLRESHSGSIGTSQGSRTSTSHYSSSSSVALSGIRDNY
jgi:hypothetical protein